MPDYEGSLPPVELSRTLWLAVVLPLVACLVTRIGSVLGLRSKARELWSRAQGLVLLASFGIFAWDAVRFLGDAPASLDILDQVVSVAQIGSLDLSLRLELDAPRALVIGVFSALAAYGLAVRSGEPRRSARDALCLAASGALCALLAANGLVLAIGWELGSLSLLRLRSHAALEGAPGLLVDWFHRSALALLVLWMLVSFWGAAGTWDRHGKYLPDFRPRTAAVRVREQPANGPKSGDAASVTLLDWPHASVRLGGAELCEVAPDGSRGGLSTMTRRCIVSAASPFVRLPVPSGRYDVLISPNMGTDELGISALRFEPGRETVFAATASTVDFRTLSNQGKILAKDGARPFRLADKAMSGLALVAWMSVLMAVAVGLQLASMAARSRRRDSPVGDRSFEERFAFGAGLLGALCPMWHTRAIWTQAPAAASAGALLVSFGAAYFLALRFGDGAA